LDYSLLRREDENGTPRLVSDKMFEAAMKAPDH
jgi:hypothetical protein